MGSISRNAKCERFIEAFSDLVGSMKLPDSTYRIESQGLSYDHVHEVVRYQVDLVCGDNAVTLIFKDVIFEPEFYERDEEIERLADLLEIDTETVRAAFEKANL